MKIEKPHYEWNFRLYFAEDLNVTFGPVKDHRSELFIE